MPTAISAGVSSTRGVTDIAARSTALMNPVCSATPRPSIATSTTPSGGKLVNVPTIFDMKAVSDSPASWFLICTGWPVRGSISVKLTPDNHQLTSHAATISSRNSTTGSGSLLPTRSMRSSERAIQPRGAAAGVTVWVMRESCAVHRAQRPARAAAAGS